MKFITFKTVVLAIIVTSAFSCKKSSSSTPTTKSKTDYLTSSAWKIQSVGVDVYKDGSLIQDATSYFKSCNLDDTFTFKAGPFWLVLKKREK